MSMSNDRSKPTASVSHFTHNGIRTGDLLVDLCSTACLQASSAQLSSALTSCLYWKQRSSWRRAVEGVKVEEEEDGGGKEDVGEENYFCAALAAVQRWRRCTDLHELITRFDDRGTITEVRQQAAAVVSLRTFNC